MKEWNVYADGKYLGTVNAADEHDARCAAFSKFDIASKAVVSVSLR